MGLYGTLCDLVQVQTDSTDVTDARYTLTEGTETPTKKGTGADGGVELSLIPPSPSFFGFREYPSLLREAP